MKIALKPLLSGASYASAHRGATTLLLCVGALLAPFNLLVWVVAAAMIMTGFLWANLPAQARHFGSETQELGWWAPLMFVAFCYFAANFMSGMQLVVPGK